MRPHEQVAEMLCVIQEAVVFLQPRVATALGDVDPDNAEEVARLSQDVVMLNQMNGASGVLEWALGQNTPAAQNVEASMLYMKTRMGLD